MGRRDQSFAILLCSFFFFFLYIVVWLQHFVNGINSRFLSRNHKHSKKCLVWNFTILVLYILYTHSLKLSFVHFILKSRRLVMRKLISITLSEMIDSIKLSPLKTCQTCISIYLSRINNSHKNKFTDPVQGSTYKHIQPILSRANFYIPAKSRNETHYSISSQLISPHFSYFRVPSGSPYFTHHYVNHYAPLRVTFPVCEHVRKLVWFAGVLDSSACWFIRRRTRERTRLLWGRRWERF